MELRCPTRDDVEQVRLWRNGSLETLRTPYPLTEEMQGSFYEKVICNPESKHRYWSVYKELGKFVGFGGLTNIEWENGLAEISLIIAPESRGKGFGMIAADLIINEGFNNMGLQTIYGECYKCNPAVKFWGAVVGRYSSYMTIIPRRKRWQGQLYDAIHFTIWR